MRRIVVGLMVVAVVGYLVLHRPPAVTASHAAVVVAPRERVLAAGESYVVALDDRGRVFGWGGIQSRDGSRAVVAVQRPRVVVDGAGFRQLSAGHHAIYALDARGRLWRAALAQAAVAPGTTPSTSTAVFGDRRWKLAFETWAIGVGIGRDGSLWYWSDEALEDQLRGRSTDSPLRSPRRLMHGLRFVDACVQGARLHAVDDRGRLWRSNDLMRRGSFDGPLQGERSELAALSADGNLRRVYCRENAGQVLALDDRGRLFGYGLNAFGELGAGEPDFHADRSALQATKLQRLSDRRWIALAVGPQVSLGIAEDGSLWGWGRNLDHELGLGDSRSRSEPALIDQSRPWVAVAATYGSGVALSASGELYAWGNNNNGVLGDGGIAASHDRPAAVLTDTRFGAASGAP